MKFKVVGESFKKYAEKDPEKIEPQFKTLSDFDNEIEECDRVIDRYEKYFEEHPETIVSGTNYPVLKYIRDELKKERDKLAASLYYKEKNK